jgi:hypothetical protein
MASAKRIKRSYRFRDRFTLGDLKIERRQTSARANRSRTNRSNHETTTDRHRKRRYRMASVSLAALGMSVLAPMTNASAPERLESSTDGVATYLAKVLPQRLPEGDFVHIKGSRLKCPQYRTTILGVGFEPKDLETVDAIMHRESRCQSSVVNTTLNKDGSHDYGLMQINGRSWCLPNRYYPDGYLQTLGILNECDDLLNPVTNLEAAYQIYTYAKGFSAWGR